MIEIQLYVYYVVLTGEINKEAIPTVGFNVVPLKFGGHELAIYDLGGQDTTRALWQHYYDDTKAIIFVIDCSDPSRIAPKIEEENNDNDNKENGRKSLAPSTSAKQELEKLLNEPGLDNVKNYLVFANKQDCENALTPFDLEAKLNLDEYEDKNIHFQASSSLKGEGIKEGMNWLIDSVYNNK